MNRRQKYYEEHKEDEKLYAKKYRERFPDKMKAAVKNWEENHKFERKNYMQIWRERKRQTQPARIMIAHAKQRAKKFGIEFCLIKEDIVIPDICPVLGIPLYFTKGKSTNNTPSLDRIDNSQGYIRENIRVISNKANALKRDMTIEDVKNLLKYMQGSNSEE